MNMKACLLEEDREIEREREKTICVLSREKETKINLYIIFSHRYKIQDTYL